MTNLPQGKRHYLNATSSWYHEGLITHDRKNDSQTRVLQSTTPALLFRYFYLRNAGILTPVVFLSSKIQITELSCRFFLLIHTEKKLPPKIGYYRVPILYCFLRYVYPRNAGIPTQVVFWYYHNSGILIPSTFSLLLIFRSYYHSS